MLIADTVLFALVLVIFKSASKVTQEYISCVCCTLVYVLFLHKHTHVCKHGHLAILFFADKITMS